MAVSELVAMDVATARAQRRHVLKYEMSLATPQQQS